MNIEIKECSAARQEAGLTVQNLDGDLDLTVVATYQEHSIDPVEGIGVNLNWQEAERLYNAIGSFLNPGV